MKRTPQFLALGAGLVVLVFVGLLAWPSGPELARIDLFLATYVNPAGIVDYTGLQKRGRGELDAVLARLAAARPETFQTRDERLSFWINAYNVCVIARVLEHLPLKQVTDQKDFFKRKGLKVAGQDMSLDEIEHGVIRKVFGDARCHAALVCAGRSCPRLLDHAYPALGLDRALDQAMRDWLADPARNRFDPATGAVLVSEIFKWYEQDFKNEAGSVREYLKRYAPAAAKPLLERPDVKIEYLKYDFTLNGV